jgi:hypothetical protein
VQPLLLTRQLKPRYRVLQDAGWRPWPLEKRTGPQSLRLRAEGKRPAIDFRL